MTSSWQFPNNPPQQPFQGPPNKKKKTLYWVVGGIAFLIVFVIGVVVITTESSGDETDSSTSSTDADSSSGRISGGTEDWLSVVCKPGTFNDGQSIFANATGGASCGGTNSGGALVVLIQYDSKFKLTNDLSQFPSYFCTGSFADSGSSEVFVAQRATDLEPLARYGFVSVVPCPTL